jgi:hypothetical protein
MIKAIIMVADLWHSCFHRDSAERKVENKKEDEKNMFSLRGPAVLFL